MSKDMRDVIGGAMRSVIGGVVGGLAGLVLGAVVPLLFVYLAFVLKGTPWRNMDQAGLVILYTGPLGAIVGTVIGVVVFRRRLRPFAIAMILGSVGIIWVLMKTLRL
jgi:hypothetical protein